MKAPSLFFFIILANFVIHHEHKISMNSMFCRAHDSNVSAILSFKKRYPRYVSSSIMLPDSRGSK